MISRGTIVWFVLLMGFTAGLELREHQLQAPCRATNARAASYRAVAQDAAPGENSFNLCGGMWESMPLWVKFCALGWLVSATGFVVNLIRDLRRWIGGRLNGDSGVAPR